MKNMGNRVDAAALVVIMVLAVTFSFAVNTEGALRFFADSAATDWLQAIGSMGTLLVAFLAYLTWRRPDDARRRADLAQAIMRQSQVTQKATFSLRNEMEVGDWSGEPLIDLMLRELSDLDEVPRARLDRARSLIDELEFYGAEAEQLLGAEVSNDLKAVVRRCRGVEQVFARRKFYLDHANDFKDNENFEKRVDELLCILGIRVRHKEDLEDTRTPDVFKDQALAEGEQLRAKLAKFLAG